MATGEVEQRKAIATGHGTGKARQRKEEEGRIPVSILVGGATFRQTIRSLTIQVEIGQDSTGESGDAVSWGRGRRVFGYLHQQLIVIDFSWIRKC